MKPTKNRIFCPSCNRAKMLFRNAKSAWLFISYNHDGILKDEGRAPIRAYYCSSCGGWHVTSKEHTYVQGRTPNLRSEPEPVVPVYRLAELFPSATRSELRNRKMRDAIEGVKAHRRMMESTALSLKTLPKLDQAMCYISYNIDRLAKKTHRMNDENLADLRHLKAWWRKAEMEYMDNTRLARLLKCCQDNIYIAKKGLEQYELVTFSEAFAKAKQMLEVAITFPGMADEKRQCMSDLESLADSLNVMRQSA